VLGALHASAKLSPATVRAYANVLLRAPRATLWLLRQGQRGRAFRERVWAAFEARGVARGRVVFVAEGPREAFLEALLCVDVLLDAFAYGAHSTAADALRLGVPVVTLQGPSFASRVASSLLAALGRGGGGAGTGAGAGAREGKREREGARECEGEGLDAAALLVTHSVRDFEDAAARLARGRPPLARLLRLRLEPLVAGPAGAGAEDNEGASPPPFDFASQARALERALRAAWEARAVAGAGFGEATLGAEAAAALALPHVVVAPDGEPPPATAAATAAAAAAAAAAGASAAVGG
jgi:hypothetical protein